MCDCMSVCEYVYIHQILATIYMIYIRLYNCITSFVIPATHILETTESCGRPRAKEWLRLILHEITTWTGRVLIA